MRYPGGSSGPAHPASSTDNAVARYDGTTGALQDSAVTISDTNVVNAVQYNSDGIRVAVGVAASGLLVVGNTSATINYLDIFAGDLIRFGNGSSYFFQLKADTGDFRLERTITAGGTTGNQTINKPAGTVNLATGASSITVTNSLVSANSLVFAVLRTADATSTFIKSVVPGAGSFVITTNANATAEQSIGWWVVN